MFWDTKFESKFTQILGVDECKKNNGGCHHDCVDKDIGYECKCRLGYKLAADGKSCEDMDDCKEFGICSQKCLNTKGSYKCQCGKGYHLAPNKRTCKAEGRSIEYTRPLSFLSILSATIKTQISFSLDCHWQTSFKNLVHL